MNVSTQTSTSHSLLRNLGYALRPQHWVKNVIVFAAPLFGLKLDPGTLLNVFIAFLAFSLTSSGFYLINDVRDIEADREHPVKRLRPIAAGLVPVRVAILCALILISASLIASFALAPMLGVTISCYALLQVGYNLVLKHKTIVDIMTIAAGFVLRALGGGAASDVVVSEWFVLCVGFLAFFLGIEKRKAELVALDKGGTTRTVLLHYSASWLQRMESIVTSGAIITYSLWTVEGASTSWMLATIPFVAYAIFKYQYLAELGHGEAPEKTLLRSPHIMISIVLWAIAVLVILLIFPPVPGIDQCQ